MAIPKSSIKKRGKVLYLHYSENGVRRRVSLHTGSLEIAKEKQRKFDSARMHGTLDVFPTNTPLASAVEAYARHMKATRTRHGYNADVSYLRNAFGPISESLKPCRRTCKPEGLDIDLRCRTLVISATYLEQITVSQVSKFIRERVEQNGIEAKTANRYREVLRRLFSWSMEEGGVRMPSGNNPAAQVKRYRETAPEICFLTLEQIDQQLEILQEHPVIRAMVATYIYAGLRREEAIWLRTVDMDLITGASGAIRVRAKTIDGEYWQPKTKRNRVVPISHCLRNILDSYVNQTAPKDWFFPSPQGKRWDPDNFSGLLRKINRAAGLHWGCLSYRHTFGSHLAMRDVSLYKISTLLGNSPEICRRHYAALLPEALVQSVEFGCDTRGRAH